MKPDPYRLLSSAYPVTIEVATRYGDLDSLNHINNVSYAGLFEEARFRFNLFVRGHRTVEDFRDEGRFVLVASNLSFLKEAFYPESVSIGVGVTRLGRTSYSLGCGMFQAGICVAVNDTTVVHTGEQDPIPLPEATRILLDGYRLLVKECS
jgi:acyl-CoA thioester hydrolase